MEESGRSDEGGDRGEEAEAEEEGSKRWKRVIEKEERKNKKISSERGKENV